MDGSYASTSPPQTTTPVSNFTLQSGTITSTVAQSQLAHDLVSQLLVDVAPFTTTNHKVLLLNTLSQTGPTHISITDPSQRVALFSLAGTNNTGTINTTSGSLTGTITADITLVSNGIPGVDLSAFSHGGSVTLTYHEINIAPSGTDGQATIFTGANADLVIRPIPEPTTLTLGIVGVGCLGVRGLARLLNRRKTEVVWGKPINNNADSNESKARTAWTASC
jgi:hypothetical protein